jgi:hypothetical protein
MLRASIAALIAVSANAAAQQIEAGEWRFDTTMTSAAMPKPQVSSFTRCVKQEEAVDPNQWMGKQEIDCKLTPGRKTADSATWEMSCPKSGMKGKGSARYSGGRLESEMQMSGEMQGRKFELTTKTTGKRLGPCKS